MAGLDFFSLVCACLCRQRLPHGRDSQSTGLGRSCPLALVLQTQGQVGVWGSGAGTAQALLPCFGDAGLVLHRRWCCVPVHAAQLSCSTLGCFPVISQKFKT